MPQKTLIDAQQESGFIGVEAAAPQVTEPTKQPDGLTLRDHAMNPLVSIEDMVAGLGHYWDKRVAFREWLLSKLVEGVHYGIPPGCEPRGNVSEKQWRHKPSLYKAGADFIVDLLRARPEFKADTEAWTQLGAKPGTFVFACYLYSETGKLIGEGRGSRRVGQKGGDENNAVKMAMKSAKVDAVINSWGLSDLFSQDIEDDEPQPPVDNPAQKSSAPKTPPRGKRCDPTDLGGLFKAWKSLRPPTDHLPEFFSQWAEGIIGRYIDEPNKASNWTDAEVKACRQALEDGK